MTDIVLASQSFRRQEMLKWLGVEFTILRTDFPEEEIKLDECDNVQDYVLTIAAGKSMIAQQQKPTSLIIASDTTVFLNGQVLNKPTDLDHARQMLQTLRGQTHTVVTGVIMVDAETNERQEKVVETKVTFKNFSDDALERYIATSEPYDKAGGYALQGAAADFVEKVEGSATNVIGFPLLDVAEMLEYFGVPIEVDVQESVYLKTGYRT